MESSVQYISFNKEFVKISDFNPGLDNRALRYGDNLFETLRANGTEPLFINDHYERLLKGVELLQLDLPDFFSISFLNTQIKGLLTRNKLFQAARVRVSLTRKTGGLYFPISNQADILIECSFAGAGPYELNSKGLMVEVFDGIAKPKSPFGAIKTNNALVYVMAGVFASKNRFDDVLLVNNDGFLVESISSNLFAIKGKTVYTPSLESGCVEGTMRKKMIHIATTAGFTVVDDARLRPDDMLKMDEVFLTNAIAGIKWIGGFRDRRYFKKKVQVLIDILNQMAQPQK